MGNGRVKGGELGEASMIATSWEEPGRILGGKGKGGKKSMKNKIGRGVSKGGRIHPKTREAPRGDFGVGEAGDDRKECLKRHL